MKKFLILGACLALAACAAPTPPTTAKAADPVTALGSFTLADLQAASADAHAHNDQAAYQCYDYLITVLPSLQVPSGPLPTVGAFVAFQKGRDVANDLGGAQSGLKSLNLACAPLVIDTQTILNKLALIGVGGAAAGGAVAPLVPLVPAVLNGIPGGAP